MSQALSGVRKRHGIPTTTVLPGPSDLKTSSSERGSNAFFRAPVTVLSVNDLASHEMKIKLCSFIKAVTQLYGQEQAKASMEAWLEESDLLDSPPRSDDRNWRAVTIAAAARLASRHSHGPEHAER
jgi:hypothetical protein